jgi:hypothetical protein
MTTLPAPRPDVEQLLAQIEQAEATAQKPHRQVLGQALRYIQHLESGQRQGLDVDHETAHNAVRRLTVLLEHFEANAERDSDAEDLAEDLRWILEDLDEYVAACRSGRVYSEHQAEAKKALALLTRCAPSEIDIDPLGNVRVLLFDGDTCGQVEGEHHEDVIEAIYDAASNFESESAPDDEAEDEDAAPEPAKPDCVIWCRKYGQWWGANRCGYTPNLVHAGIYTREEAQRIAEDGVDEVRNVSDYLDFGERTVGRLLADQLQVTPPKDSE